jgi:di/tricarboxylate transporter
VGDLELDILEALAMTVLLLAVLFQAYFALRYNLLEREINRDPILKDALNDELMRLNQLKAWRTAFFSLIIFIVVVAILSLFINFKDLMLIFITALLIGFGTYNTTLYILDRE